MTASQEQPAASAASQRKWRWIFILAGVPAVIVIAVLIMRQLVPPSFNGMVIQSPQQATNFTLTASTGERMSLQDFRGKTVLLFFGYTFCPDVCPTTLADLSHAMQILGPKKAAQVQVLYVSVDPDRDTPDRLKTYLAAFNPAFLGMTGTPNELIAASTPFGIFYEQHEGTAATGYLVDHTATVTLIDKEGYVRLVFPYGMGSELIAADLDQFVK